MVNISALKTNPQAEEEGVWVDYENTGVKLKIARIGNPAFDKAVNKLSAPHLKKIRNGDASLQEKLTKEAIAETILLDWKGIEDDDGKTLKYSKKLSKELLNDPALRDLYKFVLITSNDVERFRQEIAEDTAGN